MSDCGVYAWALVMQVVAVEMARGQVTLTLLQVTAVNI